MVGDSVVRATPDDSVCVAAVAGHIDFATRPFDVAGRGYLEDLCPTDQKLGEVVAGSCDVSARLDSAKNDAERAQSSGVGVCAGSDFNLVVPSLCNLGEELVMTELTCLAKHATMTQ